MRAFVNTEVSKSRLIASLEAHAAADRIIAGVYWHDGGCAVGCSIHDFRPGAESEHELYEPLFGVPQVLARIEDSIFERLPNAEQKTWPLRFAKAIREGADLSGVWDRFALWLLVDPVDGVLKHVKRERARAAIAAVGELYSRQTAGDRPTRGEWVDAADAARAAAAYTAAAYTAAARAAAADAAADAARAAAANAYAAAARAADAYAAAARAAAADAAADAATYADAADAYAAAAVRQADKLIELIQAC